ncbi:MAG: phosphopeptide-binding protein [Flavobacteriales bacterium]|nr:MAG: phosphopeptide-binding protein [Flavobacteriales bacterium]|tara:strand:+ start:11662 stop:12387 length:726 start_codon:yes stop_codon:yes gene_type:complete
MKKIVFYLIAIIIVGCSNESEITITKFEGSPEFTTSKLSLITDQKKENTNNHFSFNVENYELGEQTAGAIDNGLANSAKGQHIHMIVNNGPYSAHYESEFSKEINEGKNLILFFLSRSFHESVKNPNAFSLIQINSDEENFEHYDLNSEFLFYSRPKGIYKGNDTKKLLLDFYLVNTEISPEGNKVRATVDGKEFVIDEWAPYYIEGLQIGEVIVKLELINSNGELIDAPFNPVERKVTLQ